MALREVSQLPDLPGSELRFGLDLEGPTLDAFYVITLGSEVVWREPAGYEDWDRFAELKEVFRERYDGRFVSLTPSDRARSNTIGDSFHAAVTPE